MRRLEHVGIATGNTEASASIFETLFDRRPYATEVVEREGVLTTFIEAGGVKVELLEALRPDSALGRYVERHGPGLHHLAFEVDDLDAAYASLDAAGFRLLAPPSPGADAKRIFFVHPKDTDGVLIELCQTLPGEARPLFGSGPPGAQACLVRGGEDEWETVRALSRRLRVWYSPSGEIPAGLPAKHRLVVFGAAPTAGADVVVDPDPAPADRSGLLVICRGDTAPALEQAVVVRLPRTLLERLPDPAVALSDLIVAHLIA